MTWARLDDRTATKPEWVGLRDAAQEVAARELGEDARLSALAERARRLAGLAKATHLFALMWSVPALTDGRLTPAGIEQICSIGSLTLEEFEEAAELLVATGAWRRVRPSRRDPGGFQMVLGWAPGEQPSRAEDEARQRRIALRNRLRPGAKDYPNRVAAIERAQGECEYCGAKLGPDGGQIDHVDPTLFTNDLENLAHVCASCNKRKGASHRLEEVGMSFTPAALERRRTYTRVDTRANTRATPALAVSHRVGTGRDGTGRVGTGRVGTGRDGSGREQGKGRARAGSGATRSSTKRRSSR